MRYLIITGVISITVIPFLYNFCSLLTHSQFYWNSSWQVSALGGYLLYALTGYYLANTEINKITRKRIYALGVGSLLFRLIGMFYFFTLTEEKPGCFFEYLSCLSYFYAVAVFVFFKYQNYAWIENSEKLRNVFKTLAGCSFGVYLIHIIVLTYMTKIASLYVSATLWHFVAPIICYLICVGLILVVKKIPILKRIFP